MTWAIKASYGFVAVEVVRETTQMVIYREPRWGETSSSKGQFLDWRGDEATARELVAKLTSARAELVAKLTSARAEYVRRSEAARDWYSTRKAEILESAEETPA